MKRLDDFVKVRARIAQADLRTVLFPDELRMWRETPEETRDRQLASVCTVPMPFDLGIAPLLYSRMKWLGVFRAFGAGADLSLLEVGAGETTTLPEAMALYAGQLSQGMSPSPPSSKYVTLNMNENLTRAFRDKTSNLPVAAEVIEDDAINVKTRVQPGSVDIVAFEHSVNDVLQAILAEANGFDTTRGDWWEILPEMIGLISRAYEEKTLADKVRAPFLRLVQNCADVLRPGGILAMSHYMFQYDLDLGYNPELWENMIPVARPWLRDGITGGKEIFYDGFDPQWWFFWEKRPG